MKWILWILTVLAGILLLIALVGWLLPKAHQVTREAQFRESPETIWKAVTSICGPIFFTAKRFTSYPAG